MSIATLPEQDRSDASAEQRLFVLEPARHGGLPRLTSIALAENPQSPRPVDRGWWQAAPSPSAGSKLHRPARRGVARLAQLLTFLWDTAAEPDGATGVLCELDLRPGHDGVTTYAALSGRTTHHVFAAGGAPATGTVHDLAEVVQISGVCLWSKHTARLVLEGQPHERSIAKAQHGLGRGEQVSGLALAAELTLPEEEGTQRLSAVSAVLAERIPPTVPVRQVVDVPCAASMLHLAQLAGDGSLAAALYAQWCERVRERHEQVAALTERRLEAALPRGSRPVTVTVHEEMQPLADYLSSGRIPDMGTLLKLAAGQSPLWRALIDIARPDTPAKLADLSYVAAELGFAQATADGAPRMVVLVNNPAERKTLRYARQYAPALANYPDVPAIGHMAGTYPLPRIWMRDHTGQVQHNLYAHDPGRHAVDDTGQRIDLVQMAASLYTPAWAR
ncbi:hypothetical protein [Nonomuraea sp. NPDC049784]|uniref:hypothetical protein n=1 Tax=Nonomuraea sp. NPDC049784 TaxID=3154361 RepID=UPI0033F4442C